MKTVRIADHVVGAGAPTFVVAEAGVNHNEDLALALEHVRQAASAGADAIKFQNYRADRLVTRSAPKYWRTAPGDGTTTQYETFSQLDSLPPSAYAQVVAEARAQNIVWFSTPFDEASVDFLEALDVPAYKIASADLTHHPLLAYAAGTGRPLILSTGLATLGEIEAALDVAHRAGNDQIILLHCTLSYPTELRDTNLRMIQTMQCAFPDYPIGLSDHTHGTLIPALATMLGAAMIEKHYTIDKGLPGSPDHKLGVDTDELRQLVEQVRIAELALGSPRKGPIPAEEPALRLARRSIVATVDIPAGAIIQRDMLTCKRPGTGLAPSLLGVVLGRRARRAIGEDQVLTWDDV